MKTTYKQSDYGIMRSIMRITNVGPQGDECKNGL